ncbi:MAG: hypothetical protein IJ823_02830 [Bacteroidales bacterium]|nr:hypothetical protein [Bacteroidales bacterium]MBR1894172.1 hypothetical protein [Bacteroidales bacterium]
MRKLGIPLLILLAVSCQKPLFPGTPRWTRMQNRAYYKVPSDSAAPPAEPEEPESPAEKKPVVWLTAFQFPDGIRWRDGDLTGARIVVWKDSVQVLEVPAGHYPEPDRHRILDGHLWQDDSDGSETFLYRDGELMLRYGGDEVLRGILFDRGRIHTLGQRAGRSGFSFRTDGEEVFSHPSASVTGSMDDREWPGGALTQAGDSIYYSYRIPVRKENSLGWEYHVMQKDREVKMIPEGTAETVFDIRCYGGSLYRSEQRGTGGNTLVLVKDDNAFSLGISPGETVHLCKLVPSEGHILVKGYSTGTSVSKYTYWLRGKEGPGEQLPSNYLLADFYPDGSGTGYISLRDGKVQDIWTQGQFLKVVPRRYFLSTKACSAVHGGLLYAALSDLTGNTHLLLKGTEFVTFKFNGYFTGVWIE